MNIKKIIFALLVSALLIGGAYATSVNDFKVDQSYQNIYGSDYYSVYTNGNQDSGILIFQNVNDDIYDDGVNDDAYDDVYDDGIYDDVYDDVYDDGVNDDVYDDRINDDVLDHVIHHDGREYTYGDDDMRLEKNSDKTATFTDYDHATHGVSEVVKINGQEFIVVIWAKDNTNIQNGDLMNQLNQFNQNNNVEVVAF